MTLPLIADYCRKTAHNGATLGAGILLTLCLGCANVPVSQSGETVAAVAVNKDVLSAGELVARPLILDAEGRETSVRLSHTRDGQLQRLRQADGTFVTSVLYSLPVWTGTPYSIRISTAILGKATEPAVYFPRVQMLNSQFEMSRATQQRDFRLRTSGGLGALTTTIFVNDKNATDRFVLIAEEPHKSVDAQLTMIQGDVAPRFVLPWQAKLFEVVWMVATTGANENPRPLRGVEAGELEISLTPYKPRKLGE